MIKYKCPKCGMEYNKPGLCEMDHAKLVKVTEPSNHQEHHSHMIHDFKKRFFISLLLTIPILILSSFIQNLLNYTLTFPANKYLLLILSSIIFFYGGLPFLKGLYNELKNKQPGMMTLISIAISVAYIYSLAITFGLKGESFFWELATLIDIMLLGHWLEMKSILGASKSLEKLAQLMPDTAHLIEKNKIIEIKITDLTKENIILVKAGEKIPADGIILKGTSHIDESMLTGESKPIKKTIHDKVIGGSVNGDGVLEIKIENTGEDSYLNKVIKLVEQAQASKSKTQRLADKAAFWLTIIAITTSTLTFAYWITAGQELSFAIERMATVMVIACPHALGLAIPLVVSISTSISAKKGLLIRNRTAFENSRKITTIVFDKTGTLTEGKFGVNNIQSFNKNYNQNKILQLAASLETNSEHPIARGILNKAKEEKIKLLKVSDFKVLKGKGIQGKINNNLISLLSPNSIKISKDIKIDKVATFVFLIINNNPIGLLNLSDKIRPESYEAIKNLKKTGIKCWMLTGDNKLIAKKVATELELDGFFAEVLPHEKQKKIKELQRPGKFIAMVGDGINDAPALAQADIGIAIGSGTDIASETADIILVRNNPSDINSMIQFGKATYNKMIQNLFWATGYNIIAIPLAAGIFYTNYGLLIPPAIAAIFMSLSTIIVAINAKLLSLKN